MTTAFDPDLPAASTDTLQVEMVRREADGEVIEVRKWIPTQTEGQIHALRPLLRQSADHPVFTCFCCGHQVILKKHALGGHFFAHKEKSEGRGASCLYQEGSNLSLKDLDRMRYQGQREGARHLRTKELIRRIVASDHRFTEPVVEQTWRTFGEGWRKPDVASSWDGLPVVFEAQISNTYPAVVAERSAFYRSQGALLIWIFDQLPDNYWRTLHADTFCSNQQHLFVVDEECARASEDAGEALFSVYRLRPTVTFHHCAEDGFTTLVPCQMEEHDLVAFSSLRLDPEAQTACLFDVADEKQRAHHKALCSLVHAEKSSWTELEQDIRAIIQRKGAIPYETVRSWAAVVCAIEAAHLWCPVGTRYANPVSVLNLVHDAHPAFFGHLIQTLQRLGFDAVALQTGAWKKRVEDFHSGRYKGGALPPPHSGAEALLAWLYPK
jgi:hypothetical protein